MLILEDMASAIRESRPKSSISFNWTILHGTQVKSNECLGNRSTILYTAAARLVLMVKIWTLKKWWAKTPRNKHYHDFWEVTCKYQVQVNWSFSDCTTRWKFVGMWLASLQLSFIVTGLITFSNIIFSMWLTDTTLLVSVI